MPSGQIYKENANIKNSQTINIFLSDENITLKLVQELFHKSANTNTHIQILAKMDASAAVPDLTLLLPLNCPKLICQNKA